MKRIAILMVTVLLGLSASASAVHYFTRSQAERAVNYLNRQNELMIYCGYDYEIETYVLINEIWAERINSAYYELWIYGYDAYTGDEIYMPLDLQCVWLYGAGRMYNAAQYLRFRTSIHTPQIRWYIPPYHPYTRIMHRPGYVRSYHYDIHRHGWMPPSHPAYHGPHHDPHHDPHHPPLPPYYDRTPQTPAPAPTTAWTPGVEHPQISSTPRTTSGGTTSNRTATGTATETRSNSGTTTNTRSTSGTTTNTRSTSGTTTNTRSASGTTTNTRSTSGSTTTSRSTSSATTTSRSTNNTPTRANTGTTSRSSSTNTKSDAGTTTTTRSTNSNTTTTRSGNTGTTTRSTSGTTTTTRSSGTTTTTRSSGTTGTRSTSGSTTTRNR